MISDKDLESLFGEIESDRVERKSSAVDRDRIREAICAFANDLAAHNLPGVLFIGVHDDGSSAGLSNTDDLLLQLSGLRDDGNIMPFPQMAVRKRTILGNGRRRRRRGAVAKSAREAPRTRLDSHRPAPCGCDE